MPAQPEHGITAYRLERPSMGRLILEARWASYQLLVTLEHSPDSQLVPEFKRSKILHLGVLTDVLALRTGQSDLYESARDCGDALRTVDGLALDEHLRNGLDHLRAQYGLLHGHAHGALPVPGTTAPSRAPFSLPNYPAGPQLIYQMCDTYAWSAMRNPVRFPALDVGDEQRRHLVCRGLILDWAAVTTPADTATAGAAASAGHALRRLDDRAALDDVRARAYLLDSYRDLYDQDDETDGPHPADCPGGCVGDGEVLTVLTWESHGDGIYVPVHQEPVGCLGTAETEHHPDCSTCGGHGYTYQRDYRDLCLDGRLPGRTHAI
ncbi:hypothetical protein [Streptomyces niveus]|uniref:hypothetical protein n=1 Tax=Streptomyces niveus TaxID=193462 RepID=UPI00340298B0